MSLMTAVVGGNNSNTTSFNKSNNNNKINDIINEDTSSSSSTTKNNTQCSKILKSANKGSEGSAYYISDLYQRRNFRALDLSLVNLISLMDQCIFLIFYGVVQKETCRMIKNSKYVLH